MSQPYGRLVLLGRLPDPRWNKTGKRSFYQIHRKREITPQKLSALQCKQKRSFIDSRRRKRFRGYSFGYDKAVAGEVVFNTAMTGYPESLTDPSYSGQMMVLTYPLVGNYGVPRQTFETNGISTFLESEKIHAEAIIVSDYSENYSHWNAVESLGEWLKKEKIAGITGISTRELTKLLREKGSMKGKIVFEE